VPSTPEALKAPAPAGVLFFMVPSSILKVGLKERKTEAGKTLEFSREVKRCAK